VRTVEDVDSEVVLSYAEIKAVATGNPLIREHAEVAAEVARLNRLATNHARTQHTLPKRIGGLEQRLATLDSTSERLARHDARRVDTRGDRFAYTTPDGQRLTDRASARAWLRDTLGRLRTNPDHWMPVGSLGGLDWKAPRRHGYPTRFEVRLTGDSHGITWSSEELWDSAAHTIIVRLERLLDKIPDRLAATQRDRDIAAEQIARGRRGIGQPYPHAARLDELTARLTDLDTALTNIDTRRQPSTRPASGCRPLGTATEPSRGHSPWLRAERDADDVPAGVTPMEKKSRSHSEPDALTPISASVSLKRNEATSGRLQAGD
jgi:hypothetical protein